MPRNKNQLLPEFTAELDYIRKYGVNSEILQKIILKHSGNRNYNKKLYERYQGIEEGLPIFAREPKYEEENPINNKINNDFFGEIVDFKTGYFAGKPIMYGYSSTAESEKMTGGNADVEKAVKALTDFTVRNNMYGVDMVTTKNASIYGYSGRLFYIDKQGNERVMAVHGFETIILSDTDISEPEYAVRYYSNIDVDGVEQWTVDFYDDKNITTFKGSNLGALNYFDRRLHLFDYCPLQGIANNTECIGDAEKVIALIDDYDKNISDNSNEIESFVHALLIVTLNTDEEIIRQAQKSGALIVPPVGSNVNNEPIKWLTKNINDSFTEHHLQRLEDNIYRFSRTPNLGDESFGNSSGVSLKFKLHGLETKCGMFEAKMLDSAQYMFKVLSSAWQKKGIKFEPTQATMEFKRNFPLDRLSEAQTAQAFIGAGMPKKWVYSKIADVDDVDYIMQLIEEEQGMNIESLYPDDEDDEEVLTDAESE